MKKVSKKKAKERKKLGLGFLCMLLSVGVILATLLTCLSCDPNAGNNGMDNQQIEAKTYYWMAFLPGTKWAPQTNENNTGIPPFSERPLKFKILETSEPNSLAISFYQIESFIVATAEVEISGNEGNLTLSNGDEFSVRFSSNPDGTESVVTILFDKEIYYSQEII